MSISQNFPEEGPTLNLNFAGSKVLDPRITFSRPSTSGDATYMDANGLVVTAAADEPRFDHRYVNGEIESLGLLVEEQRTNLTKNSGTLTDYANQRVTNNTVSTGGPFGTGYHEKTISQVGSQYNFHGTNQISITAGQTITFSIFFKNISIDPNEIYLRFWTGEGRAWTTQRQVRYNLSTLTATDNTGTIVNKSIQAFPDGWYRLSMTATADQDGYAAESFYTTGNSIGEKYQLMGAQVEVGAFPTSYIPTSGSQATRSDDSVSMTGTNFSDWYNQSEGTILASHKTVLEREPEYARIWSINDGTSNNAYAIYYPNGSKIDGFKKVSGSDNFIGGPSSTGNHNVINKTAFSYDGSAGAITTNGANPTTYSVSGNLTLSRLNIGAREFNDPTSSIHISQLTYYPTRLSNTVLQNLTK